MSVLSDKFQKMINDIGHNVENIENKISNVHWEFTNKLHEEHAIIQDREVSEVIFRQALKLSGGRDLTKTERMFIELSNFVVDVQNTMPRKGD